MRTKKKSDEDPRISKSFKLVPGEDDDLIAFLESLPDGDGQPTIKRALRLYVQQVDAQAQQIEHLTQEVVALQQGLQQMPEWLDSRFAVFQQVLRQITVVATPSLSSAAEPAPAKMSPEAKARRLANMARLPWA